MSPEQLEGPGSLPEPTEHRPRLLERKDTATLIMATMLEREFNAQRIRKSSDTDAGDSSVHEGALPEPQRSHKKSVKDYAMELEDVVRRCDI